MNIVVVNYLENECNKDKEDIIDDIVDYWVNACEQTKLEMGHCLREQLEILSNSRICNIEFEDTSSNESRAYIVERLNKKHIDLLVTYNLAGFELATLTDGLAYNLLDCRQFHFIENEDCYSNKLLEKQRSLNMFIVRSKTK